MDACTAVEKEIDKVLSKFGNINEHADKIITDLIKFIENINTELQQGKRCFYFPNIICYCVIWYMRSIQTIKPCVYSTGWLRIVQISERGT